MSDTPDGTGAAPEAVPRDGDGFERRRARLFGIAYRMLGSVADAEDVVQDAWLRWQAADRTRVDNSEAYLARIATRLCLDRLRATRARRETYVGPWLPEPLVDDGAPAAGHEVEVAHDVSVALLLALERLSPLERAAFLLHDVFDQPFEAVAEALGRSPSACRQLAVRARSHIRAAAPRRVVSREEGARLADAFAAAVRDGDLDRLTGVLAEDAVLYSDGGGRIAAARRPIVGAERIARFFVGVERKFAHRRAVSRTAMVNSRAGLVSVEIDGTKQTTAFEFADGRIVAIYVQRNPDKLGHVKG